MIAGDVDRSALKHPARTHLRSRSVGDGLVLAVCGGTFLEERTTEDKTRVDCGHCRGRRGRISLREEDALRPTHFQSAARARGSAGRSGRLLVFWAACGLVSSRRAKADPRGADKFSADPLRVNCPACCLTLERRRKAPLEAVVAPPVDEPNLLASWLERDLDDEPIGGRA